MGTDPKEAHDDAANRELADLRACACPVLPALSYPKIGFLWVGLEDFGPDSDVDVLVEFEPGHVPGLAFFAIQEELSRLLGREIELHTPNFLSSHFRDQVLAKAVVQYEQS